MDFLAEISNIFDINILCDEPMKKHTSLGVGGNAKFYVDIKSLYSLNCAVNIAKKHKIPYKIIGNGTNLLVSDKGYDGVVFCTKNLSDVFMKQDEIYAMCGASISKLVEFSKEKHLGGLEFLMGIPATVGGAIAMNAGAFGFSISDKISAIETISNGKLKRYNPEDCRFSYRRSKFLSCKEIIVSATFKLNESCLEDIKNKMSFYTEKRKTAQPTGRSCGSVFKNPKGQSAGKLIESAGLKGYGTTNCHVSEKHGNFIITSAGATSQDVYSLIRYIKKTIKEKFKLTLKEEVEFVGDF